MTVSFRPFSNVRYLLVVQEFFEPDEYWNTSTPLQSSASHCPDTSSNTRTDRIPLMQICDQTVVSGDKSFIPSKDNLPGTSSQKLKSFAFSRGSRKDMIDPDGLPPPSKKPASEKELTKLSNSQPFNTTIHCSTPIQQVNSFITSTVTNPVCGSTVMKSSTPIMSKHSNETPQRVPPVNRHSAVKRKFPGPAGLLPKLVRKLLLYT